MRQLVFARDCRRAQGLREVLGGPHGVAALERRLRARHDRLKRDADHARSIHAAAAPTGPCAARGSARAAAG